MSASNKRWSVDDVEFLEQNFGKISTHEISDKLGCTFEAVKTKSRELGLVKNKSRWSVNDVQTLKSMYGFYTIKDIATKLNRSESAVANKAYAIGLGSSDQAIRTKVKQKAKAKKEKKRKKKTGISLEEKLKAQRAADPVGYMNRLRNDLKGLVPVYLDEKTVVYRKPQKMRA